jgi:hypothetical protein
LYNTLGYEQFYFDFYNKLLAKISNKDTTHDLLKVLQVYAEVSEHYSDIFFKIEEIILGRYEVLELQEAAVVCCSYAIAGLGSPNLFQYMEKLIVSQFNELDKSSFRDVVRGFIISTLGSSDFFQLMKMRIKESYTLFNVTELVFITKCYFDKKEGDKDFYDSIEKELAKHLNSSETTLDEICTIVDCLCRTKIFSREFQKLLELIISQRIKEITGNPKICNFLYKTYYNSGMCSLGLMNLLFNSFTG